MAEASPQISEPIVEGEHVSTIFHVLVLIFADIALCTGLDLRLSDYIPQEPKMEDTSRELHRRALPDLRQRGGEQARVHDHPHGKHHSLTLSKIVSPDGLWLRTTLFSFRNFVSKKY